MKKTFPLHAPEKTDQRVIEAIKNDVRKYVKRERRKALPAGVDFWDFDCRVGPDLAMAVTKHLAEVAPAIDAVAKGEGATAVYVEILAKPGHRTKKVVVPAPDEGVVGAALPAENGPTP
jgi:hypothetical protein